MPCYHPIPARRVIGGPWILNPPLGEADATIPCGTCLGCRTRIQLDWTHRCTHEASAYQHNSFITLTYDDTHLPRELQPHHLTNFIKRLRKAQTRNNQILTEESGIRYLACGEYGDKTQRPHYHANLFNCAFKDQQRYSHDLYESPTLTKLWGYGTAKLAAFSPATAGYVAGYITQHGRRLYTDEDGVLLEPPFKRQSTRPAIGRRWIEKHAADIQHGYLIHEGKKTPIPRYYKKILARLGVTNLIGPLTLTEVKIQQANKTLGDNLAKTQPETDRFTPARLRDAEIIHKQHHENRSREL